MKRTRQNFVKALENQSKTQKVFTENMALAYETSGKNLLDFNFKLTKYRKSPEVEIRHDFGKVFFEDPLTAVKFVFYVGDVRGGLGERKIFRACMDWLVENKPEVAFAVLELIPEYTRWDNLVRLVDNKKMRESVLEILMRQLTEDLSMMSEGRPISLLAKWMPSVNASSKETKARAKSIIRDFGISERDYRKMLSTLRAYLDVTEVKTSAKKWNEIDYATVPSQANLKYSAAFMKHDRDRRQTYLDSLKKGTTKINASVAQPHEIVSSYCKGRWYYEIKDYDEALEQMWKALPNLSVEDTLVVRDGSGSMTVSITDKLSCLDVATALTIYCSEHNNDIWRDKFITFSSRPKFVDMSHCKSLRDKLVLCRDEDDCSNTNIEKTMRLILDTAILNNCTQEEMPKNILIISDMQFDAHRNRFNWNRSLFEEIALEYAEAGYKLPKLIFWNLNARDSAGTIPMQDNELGLILCSGFSINNMRMFMTGEINPYKVLLEQINSTRYNPVEKAVSKILK